ncbi:MAG: CRISPR-associated ring nuclease [Saprospiraceae bacterium]
MKRVITTVGTSVFTNYSKEEVKESEEFGYGQNYDEPIDGKDGVFKKLESVDSPVPDKSKRDFNNIKDIIRRRWLNKYRPNASAEISSLIKIAEDEEDSIEVYLLATETALSVAACELIKEYLESEFNEQKERFLAAHFDVNEHMIKGLQVTDIDKFQNEGFQNLVDQIIKVKEENENTILNISGGYKGLIPPLTIVSQLYEIPLYYLYEDSNNPIEIGTLPIGYDWFAIERFSIQLHKTSQARKNPKVKETVDEMMSFKLVNPDNFELTIFGELLKSYLKRQSTPPLSGTMMGYFVEHKLYKYFQEVHGRYNVEHSYEPIKGIGDIDLKIETDTGFIPVEIKPANIYEDGFGTWAKLLSTFPDRIKKILPLQEKSLKESWMVLYGEIIPETEFLNEMTEALKEFSRPFKVFFLKIKPSKLNEERHIYQDFFKSDIDDSMLKEIFNSNNF